MARKETVSYEFIRGKVFELARKNGIAEVSARKIAAYAGCSTQPIFRHYDNMDKCLEDVFNDSLKFFDDFYLKFPKSSHVPFVNLGLCYIAFANKEPKLFEFLFMHENNQGYNLYNLLNGRTNAVLEEINMAKASGVDNAEQIFMKMWMLIHGAACMVITRDFDLSDAQTRLQLEDAYKAFVR